MQFLSHWLIALLSISSLSSVFASPTRSLPRGGSPPSSPFVTASGGDLFLGGSKFAFIATNAYWLPFLNSDQDICDTLADLKANGIRVVRVWGFFDVTEIPAAGNWLQLIANGTATINTGPNGLQRLDKLVELAAKYDIFVLFSLTNNWNPVAQKSSGSGSPPPLPLGFLSNSYGGMDAYVRGFTKTLTHDEFYTDQTIRKFFLEYIKAVITRFINAPNVLAWELANDPRCSSSLAASPSCNTQTVTTWHSEVAQFIASIDPNHMITTGSQGFICDACPKLFFNQSSPSPPPPAASPAPGADRKRSIRGIMNPTSLFQMITKERRSQRRASTPRDGIKIRGRWSASSEAKRGGGLGSAFDGSTGVDSQDILAIPQMDFGSFQLFPDQNSYSPVAAPFTPPSADVNGTVAQGVAWILAQVDNAQSVGKPVILGSFGIVTTGNLGFFVPFNATEPVVTSSSTYKKRQSPGTVGQGVSNTQQTNAYSTWLQTGVQSGVSGMAQYQWSEQNLTPAPGTLVQSPNGAGTLGTSPNDGYGILGSGSSGVQQTLQTASQNIG